MKKADFKNLVSQVLASLPKKFAQKMENVAIVVEDKPKKAQREKLRLPKEAILFGLYEGVPKTKRSEGYAGVPPDKITLFQKSIEAFCRGEKEIKAQVRATILHEIGHHFGLDEKDLQDKEISGNIRK